MMTERTAELHALFGSEKQQIQEQLAQQKSSVAEDVGAHRRERAQIMVTTVEPFMNAAAAMASAFAQAKRQSREAMRNALVTMEDIVLGSTDDIEAQLRDAASSLLSLGGSVSQLVERLAHALEMTEAVIAKRDEMVSKDRSSGLSNEAGGILSTVQFWCQRVEKAVLSERSTSSGISCLEALRHFKVALETIQQFVADEKLMLGLCEEELALYKKDIQISSWVPQGGNHVLQEGKSGEIGQSLKELRENRQSLSSKPLRSAIAGPYGSSSEATTTTNRHIEASTTAASVRSIVGENTKKTFSSLRSSLGSAVHHTRSLVQRVADTRHVKNASIAAGIRRGRGVSDDDNDPSSEVYPLWKEDAARRPRYTYTESEVRELEEVRVSLEQQLSESSVKAARKIESSVRELSRLTSMLNENAALQAEQLTVINKNTDAAQSNVAKAVSELQRPSKNRWNATRQLIVCLWFCIISMLIAHYVLR